MELKEFAKRFAYYKQRKGHFDICSKIRNKAKELAELINEHCPDGREKSLAVTKVEEAIMWFNTSLDRTDWTINNRE